jgi:hypothetical protein
VDWIRLGVDRDWWQAVVSRIMISLSFTECQESLD